MKTEISHLPLATKGTKVKVKIELSSEINITPFIARQKVNVFLLSHLGNLLFSGEPKLSINNGCLRWIVPVIYTIPKHSSSQVGELSMDVNTGEIILSESTPSSINKFEDYVQALNQSATSGSTL